MERTCNKISKKVMGKEDLFSNESTLMNLAKRELLDGLDKDPMDKLRLLCYSRGATGILGLARTFRNMDDNGRKPINLEEFTKGIRDTGLGCSDDEIKSMFASFDENASGTISVSEFLLKLRPQMPQIRLDIIDKVFNKMDRTGKNVITFADLKKHYCVREHPKYMNGEMSESEILAEFLKNFEGEIGDKDGKVTKEEFENYYATISASIDNDAFFDLVLRRAYKL